MLKYIQIAIGVIITSFYFFPFEFTFLPGVNTKMAMAGIGLVVLGFQLGKARNSIFSKDAVTISMYALVVSFTSFVAVTLNETRDYTYVSYIISMWVWLSAAYLAVMYMRKIHGYISVELVCNYLIAVCVFQCVSAILVDFYVPFRLLVHSTVAGMQEVWLQERLHGVGAHLDPAGSRFAVALVVIAYLCTQLMETSRRKYVVCYILAFFIIAVVGNMIARTTTVGIVLAVAYIIFALGLHRLSFNRSVWRLALWGVVALLVVVPIVVWFYNNNEQVHDNLRFAFEGFFSLAETGEWEVRSNEILRNMVVFPDNAKTWWIGDGYMINPEGIDPYYTGPSFHGYYMQTDIGYLRFIFYSGIPGLLAMMAFIWKAGRICMQKNPHLATLFWLFLAVNFTVWFKVSTDIFLVFALFLVLDRVRPEEDTLASSES